MQVKAASRVVAYSALPIQLRDVMRKGGLEREFTEQGTVSVAHIDAAAADVSDKILVKLSLGRLGLLRA